VRVEHRDPGGVGRLLELDEVVEDVVLLDHLANEIPHDRLGLEEVDLGSVMTRAVVSGSRCMLNLLGVVGGFIIR
jgi:hypothetical protein